VPSSSEVDTNSIWNGEFEVDADSCTPSDTCCCGVGLVNVSTMVGDPSTVLLAGMLDGGTGCLFQSSLTGVMAVNSSNPRRASRSIEIPNAERTVIFFNAELAADSTAAPSAAAPMTELTISNSFRQCVTKARKVGAFVPDSSPAEEEEEDPEDTQLAANSTLIEGELPRDEFVGEYEFDNSCVPLQSCCCAVDQSRRACS